MEIKSNKFTLRPWRMSDVEALARNANNIEIWNNMRDGFPYPYTEEDARTYIGMVAEVDPPTNFTIEIDGEAAGGIGFVPQTDVEQFSAEMGYWLAEPYWGKGITSEAVKCLVEFVWTTTPIVRLYAGAFGFNDASQKVLEKAGFRRVGVLKKSAYKNGKFIDKALYEIVKEE